MGLREIQQHIKELRKKEKEELKLAKQELSEKFTEAQAIVLFEFGKNLKRIRIAKGLSQDELAFKVGYSRTSITNMENAAQDITLTGIVKLSLMLGCNLTDLLESEAKQ